MAFTVEDGTGLSDANAYISVAFFKSYHDDRGSSYTVFANDAAIEKGIVKASDFVDRRWRGVFRGIRKNTAQSKEFPRVNASYDDGRLISGIVLELQEATAELALRAGSADLAPDPTIDASGRVIVEEAVKADVVSSRTKFSDDGHIMDWHRYPAVEGLMRELVQGDELLRA